MRIGVLALQGDVAEHLRMVEACGAEVVEVRTPEEMRAVEGLNCQAERVPRSGDY